ncbi:MAG: hypothetical protein RL208_612 [Pseudomonadota bacterium]|jgi:recombinational DNA repair protein (RecF pathway)
MQEGVGFLTEIRPFKDKYKIVQIYCQSGDIVSGLVRNNAKKDSIYQLGNLVKYNHFKKEKGLGVIDCEAVCLYTSIFFDNRLKYSIVLYSIFLLKSFFKDKDSVHNLVDLYITFFDHLKFDNSISKAAYLNFENKVLQMTGLCGNIKELNTNEMLLNNARAVENIYHQLNNYQMQKDITMLRVYLIKNLF